VQTLPYIVAIKGYIEFTVGYFSRLDLPVDLLYDPVRKKNTPGLDTNDYQTFITEVIFEQLVAQPLDGYAEFFFGQYRLQIRIFL